MGTTSTRSVRELVEAAKDGDQSAWNELVERFLPLVLSVARAFRLDNTDAADLSSTVWLRLVEHLADLRTPEALPGWLATTSRNEAMRLLKARRRTSPVDPQDCSALDRPTAGADLCDDLIRVERHQALRDAVTELRPQHRDLLMLLMTDPPPSYDEVSRRLGMRKGSIGPTRARALDELRRAPSLQALLSTSDEEAWR